MAIRKKYEIMFEEYNITPSVSFCFGGAVTKYIKKYCGLVIADFVTYWQDWNYQLMCVDSKSFYKLADKLFEKIKNRPKFGLDINREIIEVADEILKKTKKAANKNLKKISSEELYNIHTLFFNLAVKQFISGSIPMIVEVVDQRLSGYMLKYLMEREKEIEKANQNFSLLTTSTKLSPIKKEELDFLKLSKYIFERHNSLINKNVNISLNNLKSNKLAYQKIKKHYNKYFCLTHDFRGPAYSIKYYIKELINLKNKNIDINKKIIAIIQSQKELEKNQKTLIKYYKIDKKHQDLFLILQGFLFTKLYRKNRYTHAYYYYNLVCQEIARRIFFSREQVWFLLPDEIKSVLLDNKDIDIDKINKRFKDSIFSTKRGVNNYIIGKEAFKFIEKINRPVINKNIKKITGQIAQPGKVKGVVKLVFTTDDIKKFNNNDILVSIATNPDLLPAMKKSAAIITDAGGITCHAAIVSREFKIPCIIGTKIATKVLKDGDLVEVNANKGEIIIVKK